MNIWPILLYSNMRPRRDKPKCRHRRKTVLFIVAIMVALFDVALRVDAYSSSKARVHLALPAHRDDDAAAAATTAADDAFHCPSKCTCETFGGMLPRLYVASGEGANSVSDEEAAHTMPSLAVYCHRGGLNNSDFFYILQQIANAPNVGVLDVRAPAERPNTFQWNDNLNRLVRLKRLALVNCGIPALSRSVRMPALRHLDLSRNHINEIQLGTFIGLPLLETLDISHNRIKTLPTGAFMYSRQLKRLALSHNGMHQLAASMLRGPERLVELELDGNGRGGRLEPRQINELFTDVGEALERLELNGCALSNTDIDEIQFTRVPQLRRLGLANNSLVEVPSVAIRALEHLQTLDLSHNQIKKLEPCSFCACNITRVFLAHNLLGLNIRDIDGLPPPLVSAIHREAFADTRLVELDLSYNFFHIFNSEWLYGAQPTLRTLHLSGNQLDLQSELLHTLPRLTHLHMAQNNLREVSYALSKHYVQLRFLNLSGNGLHELPANIRYLLPSIHSLDVSHNQFSYISPLVMSTFVDQLDQIYLHHNPWDCACAVQGLQQYMLQRLSHERRLDYDHTVCARPPLLLGQPLYRVQKINDCAVFFGTSYGLTQISELLLLLSGLLIAAFVVFVLVILTLHCGREHKRKAVYVTNEHSRIQLTHPSDVFDNNNSTTPADELDSGYAISARLLATGSGTVEKTAGFRLKSSDPNNNLSNNSNGVESNDKTTLVTNKNGYRVRNVGATIRQKRNYRTPPPPPPPGSMFVTF